MHTVPFLLYLHRFTPLVPITLHSQHSPLHPWPPLERLERTSIMSTSGLHPNLRSSLVSSSSRCRNSSGRVSPRKSRNTSPSLYLSLWPYYFLSGFSLHLIGCISTNSLSLNNTRPLYGTTTRPRTPSRRSLLHKPDEWAVRRSTVSPFTL